jgi:hypothetical protein
MTLEEVEKAIDSLIEYPAHVGIIGGEPTLHPQFEEICLLMQDKLPRSRCELWTNGAKWKKYKDLIEKTFCEVCYNEHEEGNLGIHQPLLTAAKDIVEDKELMWRLIGNCWVQWRWSPSITHKGGFFCEVAAAQDMLFDGPGGYEIKPGWWNKNPNEFMDQVERYCPNCGGCVPMGGTSSHAEYDVVSESNLARLEEIGSPKIKKGRYKVMTEKLTKEQIMATVARGWHPWAHRPFSQAGPDKIWT